ncbi:hypothetical protein C0991_005944 [Blastosporella zonata]|nr:hypothetical protein C0991_005944 [Blastosporella zonata]
MTPSLGILICTVIGLSALIIILTSIRRLFFHPLRGFPGPSLAAITPLYKTYYEVFRGGELLQHLLHFNDYAAHSAIYAAGSHFTKDEAFYRSFGADESAFGAIQPQDSRLRRTLLSPLFSRRAIMNFEHVIQNKVERLIVRLASNHQENPADMMLAFRCATMDIIASYCFSSCKSSLDAQEFHDPFIIATREAIPSIWLMKLWPSLPTFFRYIPVWLAKILPSSSILAFTELNRKISEHIDHMLEDNNLLEASESPTIYRHLLGPTKQGLMRSRRGLIEEAFSLLQAGTESPGNACAIGTYHVLNNPAVHTKLFEELHKAWPDSEAPVGYSVLEKLPYLTAVIKESLRMSHGIVTPLPRIIRPTSAVISGHDVPAGTIVGVSVVCLNTDARLFEDPSLFLPERWMQHSSRELDKYLVPFSKGPRMCMGVK